MGAYMNQLKRKATVMRYEWLEKQLGREAAEKLWTERSKTRCTKLLDTSPLSNEEVDILKLYVKESSWRDMPGYKTKQDGSRTPTRFARLALRYLKNLPKNL